MTATDVETIVRFRLRSIRTSRGWSLDDLAARSNLSASTISRVETGKRTISLDVLQSLWMVLRQIADGRAEVENQYARVVTSGGKRLLDLGLPCVRPDQPVEAVGLERKELGNLERFGDLGEGDAAG